mmetsp:Transcript_5253/g.15604  ORF Transcript_5253/g.15604 Transcript_5253/m.15604 type:complete len:224 (-) Transcript_5253:231-902(-)
MLLALALAARAGAAARAAALAPALALALGRAAVCRGVALRPRLALARLARWRAVAIRVSTLRRGSGALGGTLAPARGLGGRGARSGLRGRRRRRRRLGLELGAEVLAHGGIVAILDGIVRAPWHALDDDGPLGSELRHGAEQGLVLLGGPVALLHLGAEVVEPALAALLARAARHVGGDEGPARGPVLAHHGYKLLVLSGSPEALGLALRRGRRGGRVRLSVV